MKVKVTKNRQANEFRAKADALRQELLDETKTYSKEEIDAKLEEIHVFEKRADLAAEFTPEKEIEDQGGDGGITLPSPDGRKDADDPEYKDIVKEVRKAFGGPNGYLLAMARRRDTPLNTRQIEVHTRAQAFHKRTIIGDADDASGGEWLLPLQQEESIFVADLAQPGLLERARRFVVRGRSLRIPMLDQSNDANTRPMAGIAAITIVGEAAEKPIREPKFIQRVLNVHKWAAYSEIGDEVLADDMTGDLAPTLQRAVGGQIMNEINGFITFDGDGTGEPLGALHANNAALYLVPRETTSTVTVNDVFEMDARHVQGPGSFWLAHPSVAPKLYGMQLAASSMVTWISNLRDRPTPTLLGKPVIFTHLGPPLSGVGDLALINPDFYAVALRQALTVESSIHYKFRNDITAYRFFARAGGIPIPTGYYSYKATVGNKDYPVSPFVALSDAVDS